MVHVPYSFGRSAGLRQKWLWERLLETQGGIFTLNNFLEKCRFMRNFLWIIAGIGVFLVWKNAERHVGKKNIELH